MHTWRLAGVGVALAALLAGAAGAGGLESAVTVEDLDLDSTLVVADGKDQPVDRELVLNALGLAETRPSYHRWVGLAINYQDLQGHEILYRVAFRRPVAIGSALYTAQAAACLREDAPFPGDPANPDHWVPLDAPPLQPREKLATLPAGFRTRALLFSDRLKGGQSYLSPLRLYRARLHNVTPAACARASREYEAPPIYGGKTLAAADLVRGRGAWVSAGKNVEGNIVAPPVSDVDPCWLALAWDTPQTVVGLYVADNFTAFRVDAYRGPASLSPLLGAERDWKPLDAALYQSSQRNGRWVRFREPVTLRGLRLYTDKVLDPRQVPQRVASVHALLVLTDLGTAPVPAVAAGEQPPPFTIPYRVARAGLLTLAVDDAAGRRVRNLLAREEVAAGPQGAPWDLRDGNGDFVKPGTYPWKAITHPPLELRYEFTVYPNVGQHHPENSAWLNGVAGAGGWLADHSPPFGVCAAGSNVFLGAPCSEAGVGFAACDLTGRKRWGIHSFGPFSSPRRMATDGRDVFVENLGIAYDDVGYEHVWAVDIATHAVRELINRKADERRDIGITGLEARDGRLYVAIRGREQWLANAAGEAAVDILNCQPPYREQQKPKRPHEIVPDPRNDFLRLFRLKGAPPGYARDHGLTWLETARGPGRRQHILLAFKQPVPLGSCVIPVPQGADYTVRLSVLKPEAPYPPDPDNRSQWQDFATQGAAPWDVVAAPANTRTRALLVTFTRGGKNDLADVLDDAPGGGPADLGLSATALPSGRKDAWQGRLEGLRLLRRRYANLYPSAKIRVSSGSVDARGVWVAARQEPLSPESPEVFLMEWAAPQAIRGLAVKELDCARAEVDAWTGPEAGPVALQGAANWETVGTCVPRRRMNHSGFGGHNAEALYLDDMVDFGREVRTRALRIRVVEQWLVPTREGSCAKGLLGIDPARCRLFGVAPLQYLGGEVPADPLATERLEVYDVRTNGLALAREVPLPAAGELACGPDGRLYALSSNTVVRVNLDGGPHAVLVSDLGRPLALAVDGGGSLYVFDAAPDRRVIRVYDAAGRHQRDIGTPGGYQVGPWDPTRLENVTGLDVDRENKVWAVESVPWPKRVSVWKTDGTYLREYLGPTRYGGGGVLDPWDKRRFMYGPLEFELDWARGTSRLKSLTWPIGDGAAAGERPIHIRDRVYMVSNIGDAGNTMPVGLVYLYENQRLRPVAAMGAADRWKALQAPDIRGPLGRRTLPSLQFLWSDRDGDGRVQFGEVEFEDKVIPALTRFNDDLGIQAGPWRYEVTGFLPGGVPVYAKRRLALPVARGFHGDGFYRLDSGNFYAMGNGATCPELWCGPDGGTLATYPNDGAGVGPNRAAGPYRPDQVVCQFGIVGHETAAGGDLGEFTVLHNNLGQWNLWTADGLLASRLFRDNRDPRRAYWVMPEHERGLRLDDVSQVEETFCGWVCRTREDGKYYAVAGKCESSLVEIRGLDEFRRLTGTVTVTAADLERTAAWARESARVAARDNLRLIECFRPPVPIVVDGDAGEWAQLPAAAITPELTCKAAYDERDLYLCFEVRGAGPLRNGGERWDQYFKTGGCLDFMIGTNEAAAPDRQAPVAGDKRLLMTIAKGRPVGVLYDMVVPGTPEESRWKVSSPVGQTVVDVVRRLEPFDLACQTQWSDPAARAGFRGYVAEARVPLKALGLTVRPGLVLKADWGVLQGDPDGTTTGRRLYWANPLAPTVSDLPSEARVSPDLWGWIRFNAGTKGPSFGHGPDLSAGAREAEAGKLFEKLDLQ